MNVSGDRPWISDAAVERLRRVVHVPDLGGTKYEIIEEIDRGGMGTVYRARDHELERDVALKVLSVPDRGDRIAERLRREARILARLEHPALVPVHDVGELPDGRVFYAMKLVRGQRLDAYLRMASPDLGERLRIFERICEAVGFAHENGVIHRDLKPQNVMVGAFGEVLVLDWGAAKVLVDSEPAASGDTEVAESAQPTAGTAHGTILGTPAYMAPEQARGEIARVDARSDIYALGAVLYFLLTGRAPGDGVVTRSATTRNPSSRAPEIESGTVSLAWESGVPRPLRAICTTALSADPGGRYASTQELARDVSRFVSGLSVRVYPEGAFERGRRVFVKYRVAVLLVLAYLAMRVTLLAVWGR
jgi:eukaryotic-like serine/threonine-protein kinase